VVMWLQPHHHTTMNLSICLRELSLPYPPLDN